MCECCLGSSARGSHGRRAPRSLLRVSGAPWKLSLTTSGACYMEARLTLSRDAERAVAHAARMFARLMVEASVNAVHTRHVRIVRAHIVPNDSAQGSERHAR